MKLFYFALLAAGSLTLAETMIAVAIIALLAAIAVPGMMRARKRSQATAVLQVALPITGPITGCLTSA